MLSHTFHFNGNDIKWSYIKKFAELDETLPSRIAPKLTKSHLHPDRRQQMSVRRAAQALSGSVAAGLYTHATFGTLPYEATHTAEVVLQFD